MYNSIGRVFVNLNTTAKDASTIIQWKKDNDVLPPVAASAFPKACKSFQYPVPQSKDFHNTAAHKSPLNELSLTTGYAFLREKTSSNRSAISRRGAVGLSNLPYNSLPPTFCPSENHRSD